LLMTFEGHYFNYQDIVFMEKKTQVFYLLISNKNYYVSLPKNTK